MKGKQEGQSQIGRCYASGFEDGAMSHGGFQKLEKKRLDPSLEPPEGVQPC